MAASAYLKNAAAQLRSAAADLNKQVSTMQSDYDKARRDAERTIKANEVKMTAFGLRVAAKDNSDSKQLIERDIINMKQENDEHSRRVGDMNSQIQSAVSAKTALASQLESIAGQLDGMASSPGAQ